VQESLAGLRQQCTTIIVAHRLSTIADADHTVVLEGGAVAEAGSHAELLQRGGLYAAMWQRQQEGGLSHAAEVPAAAAIAAGAAAMLPADADCNGEQEEEEEEEEGEEE
jgi:ABC-type glutathione transport system ATPase component